MNRPYGRIGATLCIVGTLIFIAFIIAAIISFGDYGRTKVLAENDDFIEIDVGTYRASIEDHGMDDITVRIDSLRETEINVTVIVREDGSVKGEGGMTTPIDRTFVLDGMSDDRLLVVLELTDPGTSLSDLDVEVTGSFISDGATIACCFELLAIPIGAILIAIGTTLLIVAKVQKGREDVRARIEPSKGVSHTNEPTSSDHLRANMLYLRMRKESVSVPYICHRCHGSAELDGENRLLLYCPHCGHPVDFDVVEDLVERMVR